MIYVNANGIEFCYVDSAGNVLTRPYAALTVVKGGDVFIVTGNQVRGPLEIYSINGDKVIFTAAPPLAPPEYETMCIKSFWLERLKRYNVDNVLIERTLVDQEGGYPYHIYRIIDKNTYAFALDSGEKVGYPKEPPVMEDFTIWIGRLDEAPEPLKEILLQPWGD